MPRRNQTEANAQEATSFGDVFRVAVVYAYLFCLVAVVAMFFGCLGEISSRFHAPKDSQPGQATPDRMKPIYYQQPLVETVTAVFTAMVSGAILFALLFWPRRASPITYGTPLMALAVTATAIPWLFFLTPGPAIVALVYAALNLAIWVFHRKRVAVDTEIVRHGLQTLSRCPSFLLLATIVYAIYSMLVLMLVLVAKASEDRIVQLQGSRSLHILIHILLWFTGAWTWLWMRAFLHVAAVSALSCTHRRLYESARGGPAAATDTSNILRLAPSGSLGARARTAPWWTAITSIPTCIAHAPRVFFAGPLTVLAAVVLKSEQSIPERAPHGIRAAVAAVTRSSPHTWTYLAISGGGRHAPTFREAARAVETRITNNLVADFATARLPAAATTWAGSMAAGLVAVAIVAFCNDFSSGSTEKVGPGGNQVPPANILAASEAAKATLQTTIVFTFAIGASCFSVIAETVHAAFLETVIATCENPGDFSRTHWSLWQKMHSVFRPSAPFS